MHVIKDTREKTGWEFGIYSDVDAVTIKTVYPGDYTLLDYEGIFAIERKATTGELSMNLGKKKHQFETELQAMSELKYKYIICEFDMEDLLNFPVNSNIPKSLWRKLKITGRYMQSTLFRWAEKYEIELHFCGNEFAACEKAIEIFQEVIEFERV